MWRLNISWREKLILAYFHCYDKPNSTEMSFDKICERTKLSSNEVKKHMKNLVNKGLLKDFFCKDLNMGN